MIKVDKGVVESKFFCESEMKADAVIALIAIHDESERRDGKEAADKLIKDIFEGYERFSELSDEEIKREHDELVIDLALELIKSIREDK